MLVDCVPLSPPIYKPDQCKTTPIKWNHNRVSLLLQKALDLIKFAGDGGHFKSTHYNQIANALSKEEVFRGYTLNTIIVKNKLASV
jgi:hypothetical protein